MRSRTTGFSNRGCIWQTWKMKQISNKYMYADESSTSIDNSRETETACVAPIVTRIVERLLKSLHVHILLVKTPLILWRPLLPYGYSYKATRARWVKPSLVSFWHPGTLALCISQSTWLRIVHSGDWCCLVLRTPTGACHTRRNW